MLQEASNWFWSEDFWLPPNVTWSDLQGPGPKKIHYSQFGDLAYPLLFAWGVMLIKLMLEKNIYRVIGEGYTLEYLLIIFIIN